MQNPSLSFSACSLPPNLNLYQRHRTEHKGEADREGERSHGKASVLFLPNPFETPCKTLTFSLSTRSYCVGQTQLSRFPTAQSQTGQLGFLQTSKPISIFFFFSFFISAVQHFTGSLAEPAGVAKSADYQEDCKWGFYPTQGNKHLLF